MGYRFPGMDPYLENPALWANVHGRLIVAIADTLSPVLLPKYQPIIEEFVYETTDQTSILIGRPDVVLQNTGVASPALAPTSVSAVTSPLVVELPSLTTTRQRYIEIRNAASQEVVTVIEVLSPTNKTGEGRLRYLQKREKILTSQANLVEVDLLHRGEALPMGQSPVSGCYRILVSPVQQRPRALLYPFNLPQPLPKVAVPLRVQDEQPVIDFQTLIEQVYTRSGYEYSIDYNQPPQPSWDSASLGWIANVAAL